jgi:hypothetical protein
MKAVSKVADRILPALVLSPVNVETIPTLPTNGVGCAAPSNQSLYWIESHSIHTS